MNCFENSLFELHIHWPNVIEELNITFQVNPRHFENVKILALNYQQLFLYSKLKLSTIKMTYLDNLQMVYCTWICLVSKFVDFIDTFCLVARKKFDNVSLLHVYHHSIMPINVWFGVRFIPGGHGTFFGLINAFVHIIMYTYYLISGLGPRFKKYVW